MTQGVRLGLQTMLIAWKQQSLLHRTDSIGLAEAAWTAAKSCVFIHQLTGHRSLTTQTKQTCSSGLPCIRKVMTFRRVCVARSCTMFRSFMHGKCSSKPRPPHPIRNLVGWCESSTLPAAISTCRQCPHLISTQNAPFSPPPPTPFTSVGVIDPAIGLIDNIDQHHLQNIMLGLKQRGNAHLRYALKLPR